MLDRDKIWVVPYKMGSGSAKLLANGLNIKRIQREDSNWEWDEGRRVINWGCSIDILPDNVPSGACINDPYAVGRAVNKLYALTDLALAGVPTVPWTVDKDIALGWLGDGSYVYSRTILDGHSGEGIYINDPEKHGIGEALLYTKHMNAITEWRVHVAFGKAIDVRRKAKLRGHVGNKFIRNHGNGYIYKLHGNDVWDAIPEAGVDAVRALGLEFGSVDILLYREKPYVLEVNTASGMHGSTIDSYVKAFEEELG